MRRKKKIKKEKPLLIINRKYEQLKQDLNFMLSKYSFSKKISLAIIALAVVVLVSCQTNKDKSSESFYQAAPDTFIQTVKVAGIVSPAEKIDLAFEKTGRLVELNLDINDRVETGQILAKLNTKEADAQIQDAKANLSGAYSNYSQYEATVESEKSRRLQLEADLEKELNILEQMKKGSTNEEILVAENIVSNAEKSVLDAKDNLDNIEAEGTTMLSNLYSQVYNTAQEAYYTSSDVLTRITGVMFYNPTNKNAEVSFYVRGDLDRYARLSRIKAFEAMSVLNDKLSTISSESLELELDEVITLANASLESTRRMLNDLNTALDNNLALNENDFNDYKTAINLASSNLVNSVNSLNNLQQNISQQKVANSTNLNIAQSGLNEAENALALAESELKLVKAGPTPEEINAQNAVIEKVEADISAQDSNIKSAEANLSSAWSRIEQAKASVLMYEAEAEKNILIAPIPGKITARDYSLGEIVQANIPVYKLSSSSNYEIIADIPELDIPNISLGNAAEVYLDSYGEKVLFEAVVTDIEPAERIIDGLAKYRITLQFLENDKRIKSGMTANLEIVVAEKENIISVPARAVIEKDGGFYIRVENKDEMYAKGSETVLKKVELGEYSNDGRIEVIKGLRDTDSVILN